MYFFLQKINLLRTYPKYLKFVTVLIIILCKYLFGYLGKMQVLKTQAFTVFIILLLGNLVILECEACNKTTDLNKDSGVLQSPSFPQNYPNEVYCSWNIRVNQSQHVFLMFSSSFSLQAENNTDVIRVYDGGNTTGEVLGVFYGGHPPPKGGLYSSANQMFVVFKTDNNKSFSGFQASYHALTCSGKDVSEQLALF